MREKGKEGNPENNSNGDLQPVSLAEEMRNTLDPRLIFHNFVTAPPCKFEDLMRDIPLVGLVTAGSLSLLQGIVFLHERLNFPNPEAMSPAEGLAWVAGTLAMMGAARYISRRLPF